MTSTLVFAMVFGIHYNFFIILPIQIYRSNDFFPFYKTKCTGTKNRARLSGFACQSAPDWHRGAICPGLITIEIILN